MPSHRVYVCMSLLSFERMQYALCDRLWSPLLDIAHQGHGTARYRLFLRILRRSDPLVPTIDKRAMKDEAVIRTGNNKIEGNEGLP